MSTVPTDRVRVRERPATPAPSSENTAASLSNRLVVIERRPDDLHPAPRRVRVAGKTQVTQLETNIERFGCVVPVLITPACEIIDGHNIWKACKNLGRLVPTITVHDMSEAEIRALRISLNRMAELSTWDDDILKQEFTFLFDTEPDLASLTGFDMAEIDGRLFEPTVDDDDAAPEPTGGPFFGVAGDVWLFERGHRLLQGDARDAGSFDALMGGEKARALVCDPPYGCKIDGHASKSHPDFLDGSNMTSDELKDLLTAYLRNALPHLQDGALSYAFMDGRGLHTLMNAAALAGLKQIALCVWDKVHPAMGSFYRQQAEFIQVCKCGGAAHVNNVELGKNRRNRSTVWSYPGLASFGVARKELLAMHPTVKPVGLMADIILDCGRRGDIILDPFAGSGTTLLAAHRIHRRAYAMELDPKYIDVAVRRMERRTGTPARHEATGRSYDELMRERQEKH